MPVITITQRDILRGKVVEPAWYRVHIDSAGEKTAKSGQSQFYPMEGTILFNADNGSKEFAGVPTPQGWGFSELAMGFAVGFLESCGAEVGPNGGRFELGDSEGKEVDIFIENGTYEGRTVNKINHKYRRPNPEVVAV
jgi:hypothetical protein